MAWFNWSRENPIQINIESDTTITAKFINKQNLITRFDQIVIGTGENGPRFTLRWDEMKIFFHQTLTAMSDTFERATNDDKMSATMRDFCDYFAEKLAIKKEK